MRRRVAAPPALEEPSINMTPLIDVVFVILIMFIVVAPLLEIDRVDLAEGLAGKEEVVSLREQEAVSISVDQDNRVKFNHVPVGIDQLEALLKEAHRKHPGARPQLYQDRQAHFGTYQRVKNAAEAAGFDSLDVVLKPG